MQKKINKRKISLGGITAEPGGISRGMWALATRCDGFPVNTPVILINGRYEGPVLWIQGAVHGDEPGSTRAVLRLANSIEPDELRGCIILLPAMNISAYQIKDRGGPADGKDFSRNFPGSASGTFSDIAAHDLANALVSEANYVIDIHTGASQRDVYPFASFWSGYNASEGAKRIAIATGVTAVVARSSKENSPVRGTSLYAVSKGIPAILFSAGGLYMCDDQSTDPLLQGCRNVLKFLEMIGDESPSLPEREILEGMTILTSKFGGLVVPEVQLGQWASKNDPICTIYDLHGDELETVFNPYPRAQVLVISHGAFDPGDNVAEVAGGGF